MNRLQTHFESRFNDLIKFKKATGRWPSPKSEDFTERSIGVWCVKIKLSYNKGKLEEGRQKAFEKIGFPLNHYDHQWNKVVKKLKLFIEKNKRVPISKEQLYDFSHYNYIHYNDLSNARKEVLQSFGFMELWQIFKQKREKQWDEHFDDLIKFFKKHGKLPSRKEECFLEPWVFRQRRMLKEGLLSEEQKLKFERAGINLLKRSFKRRFKKGETWEGNYEEVKDFIKDNGRLPKYTSYPSKERAMLQWYSNQKRAIKKGKLPDEKIKKFQTLFFNADSNTEKISFLKCTVI